MAVRIDARKTSDRRQTAKNVEAARNVESVNGGAGSIAAAVAEKLTGCWYRVQSAVNSLNPE